ncbi:MAG: hypothetical protein ABSD92_05155 [Candidatus Bathyarchaeia archaeon]
MIYSWFLSYPLTLNSPSDTVFNHISVFYWISLAILLTSMFLIAVIHENHYSNWIISVGLFTVIYSISYFYAMVPGADSSSFAGLIKYFLTTNNLTPNVLSRYYYQWPSFFILAKVMISVTGINLEKYAFLLYGIIGFLITTTVYIYASKFCKRGGTVAVVAFTIVMFSFLNYQFAPFSLSFAILLILFMLETQPRSKSSLITTFLLFFGICIMHEFVPAIFILYLLIQSILTKSAYYRNLFILFVGVYLTFQVTFVSYSFGIFIKQLISLPSDYSAYSSIISSRLLPAKVPIDVVAQQFSRGVTISLGLICVVGFIFLVSKRKLRPLDIGILLTGIVYSGLGIVLNTIGYRTLPLIFLPLSLGAVFFFNGKLRPYFKAIFLILLVCVVFIPLHNSFTTYPILFQSTADQTASNFLIEKYDWASPTTILMYSGTAGYISPQINTKTEIISEASADYTSNFTKYDCIFYNIGLGITFDEKNISFPLTPNGFNVVYDDGSSYIFEKIQHSP